jgi:hypothetical protein
MKRRAPEFRSSPRKPGPRVTDRGPWIPSISASTRVHSPSKTGVNAALNDALCAGMNGIERRAFILALGGMAAWPLAARAQQPIGRTGKMPRVGLLMPGPAAHSATTLDPFYRGLHELGYIEGQNLAIEQRNGDWKPDRLPALAA